MDLRAVCVETAAVRVSVATKALMIIIIINRISRAPIYHTRWQHRVLCSNTNPPPPHTHTHTHTHRASDEGMGRAVKNSLEIIIKQVRLEGGFERGGRIRVAECLRQIVPDRWASIPIKGIESQMQLVLKM